MGKPQNKYLRELQEIGDALHAEHPWNKLDKRNIEVGVHLLSAHYTNYLHDYICQEGYFGCKVRDEAFKNVVREQRSKSNIIGEIVLCDQLIRCEENRSSIPKRARKTYQRVRVAAEMLANKKDVELKILSEEPDKTVVHQFTDLKGNVVGESFSAGRPSDLIYIPGATPFTKDLHQTLERYYGRMDVA